MVKANVDKIIDVLREKKSASINDLSGKLKIPKEDLQKSAEYLEEDGVVKIEHKFPNVMVTLLKDPETPNSGEKKLVEESKQQKKPEQAKNTPSPAPQTPKEMESSFAPPKPPESVPNPNQQLSQSQNPKQVNINVSGDQISQAHQNMQHKGASMPPTPQAAGEMRVASQPQQTQNNEKTPPFLIAEQEKEQEPIQMQPQPENTQTKAQFTQSPYQRDMGENSEEDPFSSTSPEFELGAPVPNEEKDKIQSSSPLRYSDRYRNKIDYNIPDHLKTDVEKIDFLIDKANNKMTRHDYKDLNVIYREIFERYKEGDLSPSERYIIGDKVNEVFERIKRVYLIEQSVL